MPASVPRQMSKRRSEALQTVFAALSLSLSQHVGTLVYGRHCLYSIDVELRALGRSVCWESGVRVYVQKIQPPPPFAAATRGLLSLPSGDFEMMLIFFSLSSRVCVFKHPQPALLYLVPFCVFSLFGAAALNGQVKEV